MQDPTKRERRKRQARDLNQVVGRGKLTVVEPDVRVQFAHDTCYSHEYGRLAERLFGAMALRAYEQNDEHLIGFISNVNVIFGCYVLTKILSYAPAAYRNYCQQHPELTPSVQHLGQIMLRSRDILSVFADVGRRENRVFELAFGLRQYEPTYESVPFIIQSQQNDEPTFELSPATYMNARLEAYADPETLDEMSESFEGHVIHCPAIGHVLSTLWDAAVNECVERPNLFGQALDS